MRIRRDDLSATHTVIIAVLVGVACYLGASADTWLTFPGTGAGILFPPYAIVTAALLRSPPRTWWVFFLAAAAGDFLPHVRGGATPTFALMSELVNDLRATVTAVGLLRFTRRPFQLDTLRDAVAYLVFAVFLAPCLGAFVGAGLVVAHVPAQGFWLVWVEWMLSNAITALALLPVLLIGFGRLPGRAGLPDRRRAEAALLLVGLLGVGIVSSWDRTVAVAPIPRAFTGRCRFCSGRRCDSDRAAPAWRCSGFRPCQSGARCDSSAPSPPSPRSTICSSCSCFFWSCRSRCCCCRCCCCNSGRPRWRWKRAGSGTNRWWRIGPR